MNIELFSKEDLEQFKQEFKAELLADLSSLILDKINSKKRWVRGTEAKKILGGISEATLQNIRINSNLKYSRVMGTYYYAIEDIEQMMKENQIL